MKVYEAAIKLWPQNGWAHYELGMTKMRDRMTDLGIKPKPVGDNPEIHTPEILAHYAESRKHDPLQTAAYQGLGENIVPRIQAAIRLRGVFEKGAKASPDKTATLAELITLSNDLQTAEQDELALEARLVAVIRRGGFRPEDHPFLTKSLRRLVSGDETEAVLNRLAGGVLVLRQIVAPEPGKAK